MSEPFTLPIRTERLVLSPLGVPDRDALHAFLSLPEVCRYLPYEPMDYAEIDRRLGSMWASATLPDPGGALTLGVRVEGALIGYVVLFFHSAEEESGEIGWVIDPGAEGHGYATEAAAALLPVAFESLGLHRVVARMDPANTGSAAVATRIGMRFEGTFVENARFKGEWADTTIYAILEREWRA